MGVVLSCCSALACSCCIGLSCQCFGSALTITKSIATRVVYTTIFLIVSLVAWLLDLYAYDILSRIPYVGNDCVEETCGAISVYRISFALFVFHFVLSVILVGVRSTKDIRAPLNDGWWPLKFPILLALLVGSFFIPASFFTFYAWIAIFGAGLFILVQLVLLVDFAYSWSESWVAEWQGDDSGLQAQNKSYLYALLAATGLFYLLAICLDIFMYSLFCTGDCWYNALIITVIFIMCLFLSACSIHPRVQEINPRVGLLQASIFSLYCTYYTYSAILSNPQCGELPFDWAQESATTAGYISLIFGAIFTIVSVVYSSVRAGTSALSGVRSEDEVGDALLTEEEKADEAIDDEYLDDEVTGTAYSYALFHMAFALGAMYVGMLLTNWSIITGEADSAETDSGWVSVSIKLTSCLIAGALYTWTVFAPVILPGREWE